MGRAFTQFKFPDSDSEDAYAVYSAFLDYRMPDGSRLHIRQRECWCPVCERIDMAEDVPSLAELQAELDRLLAPDEETLRKFAFIDIPVDDLIAETRKRIEWRRHRRSPAKCLHCGSTNITALPHNKEFAHPKTRERVLVAGWGFLDAAPWHAEFTTEGDPIVSNREADRTNG